MAKATARHILVANEEECNALKTQIEGGASLVVSAHGSFEPATADALPPGRVRFVKLSTADGIAHQCSKSDLKRQCR